MGSVFNMTLNKEEEWCLTCCIVLKVMAGINCPIDDRLPEGDFG
jgi:hypothetical protein